MKALFGIEGVCSRPTRDFDLQVKLADGDLACIEIKVWNKWSRTQREKQIDLLRAHAPARGFVILLANSAERSKEDVLGETKRMFNKIGYSDLYTALDAVRGKDAVPEIAMAYRVGLN